MPGRRIDQPGQLARRGRSHSDRGRGLPGGDDVLAGLAAIDREDGAQRLVPADHVTERRGQRAGIQLPGSRHANGTL